MKKSLKIRIDHIKTEGQILKLSTVQDNIEIINEYYNVPDNYMDTTKKQIDLLNKLNTLMVQYKSLLKADIRYIEQYIEDMTGIDMVMAEYMYKFNNLF